MVRTFILSVLYILGRQAKRQNERKNTGVDRLVLSLPVLFSG
jgi:hypothetical protein